MDHLPTQRRSPARARWWIANEVCSMVDGWNFQQYVLGIGLYRFISRNIAANSHQLRSAIDAIVAEIETKAP